MTSVRRTIKLLLVPIDILHDTMQTKHLFIQPFQEMVRIAWTEGHKYLDTQPDLRLLVEARDILNTLSDIHDFACNCEPTYESDTNFYNHKDNCPAMIELGVEATLTDLEKAIESLRRD